MLGRRDTIWIYWTRPVNYIYTYFFFSPRKSLPNLSNITAVTIQWTLIRWPRINYSFSDKLARALAHQVVIGRIINESVSTANSIVGRTLPINIQKRMYGVHVRPWTGISAASGVAGEVFFVGIFATKIIEFFYGKPRWHGPKKRTVVYRRGRGEFSLVKNWISFIVFGLLVLNGL